MSSKEKTVRIHDETLSGLISSLLKFNCDLQGTATHAVTEIDFRTRGIDAGNNACLRLAGLMSPREVRAKTPEQRVDDYEFDPLLITASYKVFRDSGYRAYAGNMPTKDLIADIDCFATELETMPRLPEDRLLVLWTTCLGFSRYQGRASLS